MRRVAVRSAMAAVALVLVALVAAPAAASSPPGPVLPPADTNPPGVATEATIVDMIHTSALFGGDVPSATALTPYPESGIEDERDVTTAQIVLEDPSGSTSQTVLAYCIDLGTETTIGIHYGLGDWTEANVPNLPYVQWILDNHYPLVPSAPAAVTETEKVRAVQGAIWYFTDRFVVSPAYPEERVAVAEIVAAAQAAVDPAPAPPPLPTLTIDPATLEAAVPGEIVGPFAVDGSVSSAALVTRGTTVYADAAGTIPIPDGAAVTPGTQVWAGFDPAVAQQGFALEAVAQVAAGNVFLYDGANPPRTGAQKLVLAANADVALRASADIVPEDAGELSVAVSVAGPAAGMQGLIGFTASCVAAGGWMVERSGALPAGATGTTVVTEIGGVPAGAVCTVVQTADGAEPDAALASSVVSPTSVVIASDATATITLANTYDIPVPGTGALTVVIAVEGDAAGAQAEIGLDVRCVVEGGDDIAETLVVPAGAVGTLAAGTLNGIPVGAECAVSVTADGTGPAASLVSSTVDPASVEIVEGVSTATVINSYAVPAPTPTPPPSPSPTPTRGGDLPDTGRSDSVWWGIGMLAVLVGAGALSFDAVRRLRRGQ